MFDRRYPNLFRVADAPGVAIHRREAMRRVERVVKARTDFNMAYNAATGCLHLYLKDPAWGPALPQQLVQVRRGSEVIPPDAVAVDELCQYVQRGRMSQAAKDREAAYRRQAEESEKRSVAEARKAESARRVEHEILPRLKNRAGMHSKFQPSVLVDGLKGASK